MVAGRWKTHGGADLAATAERRPDVDIRWIAPAFLAGILAVTAAPQLPPLWLFLPLLLVPLWRFPGRSLLLAAVLGAAWTTWNAERELAQRLPLAADGRTQWVAGRIEGLPEHGSGRVRFQFVGNGRPRRIRVSWYGEHPAIVAGDCWRLRLKLSAPHGSANPGGFDYEAWLWRRRIGATGYVRAARRCPDTTAGHWSIDRWRQAAAGRLAALLDGHPMSGVIRALVLGERSGIDDAQWRVLRNTGTSHLVAISGLHIGLIAALVFLGLRWLTPRLPGGTRVPAPTAAALGAAAAATGYALLAGLSLPTQRALLMLLVVLGAVLLRRRTAPSRLLALAALAVLAVNPFVVLAPGFWLSFGAVAWILYLMRRGRSRSGRWRGWLWLQPALVLCLAPLTLFWFGQASLAAPLANAVLIPAFAVVVPMVLGAATLALAWPALGGPMLLAVANVLGWGWSALAALAQLPAAHFALPQPGLLALVSALAGVALLLAPRGIPGRWLGVIGLLPLLVPPAAPAVGGFRLVLLDVGQGLAAVVRTADHTLLFDAGPRYRTGFDAGEALVVPFFRTRGISRLDRLVVSHGDIDHRGGVPAVRRALFVADAIGVGTGKPCRAGMAWRWDGVAFTVLHPDSGDWHGNNGSCVLRVAGPGGVLLLTGDIETAAERHLLERDARALAADILVLPHHGSATSSSKRFVRRVAPDYALAPAGWHNRWDFPRPVVVARYREVGARLLTTGTGGAIRVDVRPAAGVMSPRRWRDEHRRFWQLP